MSGGTGISWRRRREQSWVLFLLSALFVVLAAIPGDRLGPWWLKAALAVVCGVGGVAVARMKQSAKQDDVDVDTLEKSMLTAGRGTAPMSAPCHCTTLACIRRS